MKKPKQYQYKVVVKGAQSSQEAKRALIDVLRWGGLPDNNCEFHVRHLPVEIVK